MLSERLALLVSLDARGAVKGLESVGRAADRNLSKAEAGLARTGKAMQKVGVGMAAVGALAIVGLGKAAMASETAELSLVKLENSLKNNPRLAGESSKAYVELADAIQGKTAAENDSIIAGMAILGTFRVTGDQIKKITPLVVDYARKFGVDLVDANKQVGKALDGNVGALKRNGVSIDETLFKTDRYAAVQKALSEQVGGFAEAEGKTFAGSLERLKNQLGDLEESVGKGAVDAFTTLLDPVIKVADALNGLDGGLTSTVGKMATFGAVGLTAAGGLSFLVGKAIELRSSIKDLPRRVKELTSGLSGLRRGALGAATAAGVAVGAWMLWKSMMEDAASAGRGEVDALKEQFDGLDPAKTSMTQLRAIISGLDGDIADLSAKKSGSNAPWDADFRKHLDASIKSGGEWRTQLAGMESAAKALAASEGISEDAALRLILAHDDLKGAIDPVTGAFDDQALAAGGAAAALDDLDKQLRGMFDPLFKAEDALADLTASQLAVTAAEKEHGKGSPEALQARKDATRAALDYESALIGLKGKIEDGTVSVEDSKATLADWVKQGLITQTQADEAAWAFGILEGKANDLDGKDVVITVDADTRAAEAKFATLRGLLGLSGGTSVGVHGGPAPKKRANGGAVAAGELYQVNERGVELFRPSTSGTIVPNHRLAAAGIGSSTTTVSNVFHITALDPAGAARAVKDALRTSSARGVA